MSFWQKQFKSLIYASENMRSASDRESNLNANVPSYIRKSLRVQSVRCVSGLSFGFFAQICRERRPSSSRLHYDDLPAKENRSSSSSSPVPIVIAHGMLGSREACHSQPFQNCLRVAYTCVLNVQFRCAFHCQTRFQRHFQCRKLKNDVIHPPFFISRLPYLPLRGRLHLDVQFECAFHCRTRFGCPF
jgi:hypothetical protein